MQNDSGPQTSRLDVKTPLSHNKVLFVRGTATMATNLEGINLVRFQMPDGLARTIEMQRAILLLLTLEHKLLARLLIASLPSFPRTLNHIEVCETSA